MQLSFSYGEASYVGRLRVGNVNQDTTGVFVAGKDLPPSSDFQAILCIADGMGGGYAGEVASQIAVRMFASLFASRNYISWCSDKGIPPDEALHAVKERIVEINKEINTLAAFEMKPIGTTLDALVVKDDSYYLGHVGDSRVYRMRDGNVSALTNDHSAVAELVRNNIPPDEAKQLVGSNIVTNILGNAYTVDVDVHQGQVRPGDYLILCTDGVNESVTAEDIREAAESCESCQEACNQLLRLANERDGSDNISVVIARAKISE